MLEFIGNVVVGLLILWLILGLINACEDQWRKRGD